MKIAFDVMGFENDISQAINAARKFVKKYSNVEIILVGKKENIIKHLKRDNEFEIRNASEIINQYESPIIAMRKKDSSMMVAIQMVQNNEANAVVSPGSTPSFVSLSYSNFGLIKNISKPAFTPTLPSINRIGFNMLDVGANKTCDENDLVNFALMGHAYSKFIRKINNPIIKILNIGTEDYKGLDNLIKANEILKKNKNINYQGFVEPGRLLFGETDVVVTDGFTGNICLKSMEGSMKALFSELKKNFKKPSGWFGALFSIIIFKKIKKSFDYKNFAGALVLGLNKIAIKTHGSADEAEFISALRLAKDSIENDVVNKIQKIINGK